MNTSAKRWTHKHTGALLFTGVLVVICGLLFKNIVHTNAATQACSAADFTMGSSITNITAHQELPFYINSVSGKKIVRVYFIDQNTGKGLGEAIVSPEGTNAILRLKTQYMTSGVSYLPRAEVAYVGGSCYMQSPTTLSINVPGHVRVTVPVAIAPNSWSGVTNEATTFTAAITSTDASIGDYIMYQWAPVGGYGTFNSPIKRTTIFNSGPTPVSNGQVKLTIQYAGQLFSRFSTINIASSSTSGSSGGTSTGTGTITTDTTNSTQQNKIGSTTTTPTTNTTSATTSTSNATTTQTNTTTQINESIQQSVNSDPTLRSCLISAVGETRLAAFTAKTARPSYEELQKMNSCFASINNIIPSNFAPVEPKKVSALPTSKKLTISELTNVERTEPQNNEKTKFLKIAGKALPNSLVIVYVFSEPLVLTTTANANGEWSYALESPLEPGKHEIYAVVDQGNGQYEKTNPFGFFIEKAVASAENPNGFSLALGNPTPTQSNRSLYAYLIGASVFVLGLIIFATIFIIRHRHNNRPKNTPPTSFTPTIQPPTNPTALPPYLGS